MKIIQYFFFGFLVIGILASCKDPYMPHIKNGDSNVLVVEGFIDGADVTTIQLSRARLLSNRDTATRRFVSDAVVWVENDAGDKFPLSNIGDGKYSATYFFDPSVKYSLHIATADNHQYRSDWLTIKQAPPIDAINLRIDNNGALIMVSAHDDSRKTNYYRWQWEDTWEFHSTYFSTAVYNPFDSTVNLRNDNVFVCWKSDHSKEILINSSAKLNQDEVRDFPINRISFGDYRLGVLYSIKVKQFAIDSLEYNYWFLLKKNSEEMGSLFDPQPSNIRGNMHSISDTSETVIGYVGAGMSTSRRQFFAKAWSYRQNCPEPYLVPKNKDSLAYYFGSNGGYTPINDERNKWSGAFSGCVDCTTRGTNVKPIFWP